MEDKLKYFGREFWDFFVKENKNFTEPCVLKNVIEQDVLDQLHQGVLEVLIHRLDKEDVYDGFRVYIEGTEQKDSFLEKLCKTPPLKNEDIQDFSKRIFSKKFGIIINSGERHSDLISENIISMIAPLIELKGLPPLGIEITIFIGNYGWTPLGIHQDHEGENVIHFHLGPGGKEMYTWEEKEYKKIAKNEPNNQNIEPLLKYAKKFSFGAGDIYYMPWNKFHVGYTEELSVGITLWFNNPPKQKYVGKILESFQNQFIKKENTIIPNKFNLLEAEDSYNDILSVIELDENILNFSVKDFFKFISNEFNYCLMSNGGWQTNPLTQEVKSNFNIGNYLSFKDKSIVAKQPFKILYKEENKKLIVYVRGSKFVMDFYKELVAIIDEINTYKIIKINELLDHIGKDLPKEAALYFVSILFNKRGIEILN